MAVVFLVIVVLISLGNFADFLLGSAGGRKAKDRLVELWVAVERPSWAGVIRWAGKSIAQYIEHRLGNRVLSPRYLAGVAVISVPLPAFFALDMFGGIEFALQHRFDDYLAMVGIVIAVYIVDVVSWGLTIKLFNAVGRLSRVHLAFCLIGSVIVAGVAVSLALIIAYAIVFVVRNLLILGLMYWLGAVLGAFVSSVENAFMMSYYPDPLLIATLPTLLPYLLFIIVTLTLGLVTILRKPLHRPLSLILQRAEASQKGVFTLIAMFLSAIMAVLTAAQKVFV